MVATLVAGVPATSSCERVLPRVTNETMTTLDVSLVTPERTYAFASLSKRYSRRLEADATWNPSESDRDPAPLVDSTAGPWSYVLTLRPVPLGERRVYLIGAEVLINITISQNTSNKQLLVRFADEHSDVNVAEEIDLRSLGERGTDSHSP